MRALLGILLSVLLLQAQVFALSGGPQYGGVANITGTYGGVMVEQCNCDGTSVGGSIAIYSVNIVQSGISTGNIMIFSSGRIYPGTVSGVGDTTSGDSTFKGVIEASFNYILNTLVTNTDADGNVTTTNVARNVTATTNGILDTIIDVVRNGSIASTLMRGTATLQLSNGRVDGDGNLVVAKETIYDVSGYRQALPAA